jgi:hypothetical protein
MRVQQAANCDTLGKVIGELLVNEGIRTAKARNRREMRTGTSLFRPLSITIL